MLVIEPWGGQDPFDGSEHRCVPTRTQLEAARDAGVPTLVVTRSDRVLRDLPLLGEVAARNSATVLMKVATVDPELAALWEPEAPPPDRRLAALRPLRESGVAVGLLAAPLVPFLMDDHGALRALLAAAADAGAQFLLAEPMPMRPVSREDRSWRLLAEGWPQLLAPIQGLYGVGPYPRREYVARVVADARRLGTMVGLPYGMPRSWSPGGLLEAAFAHLRMPAASDSAYPGPHTSMHECRGAER